MTRKNLKFVGLLMTLLLLVTGQTLVFAASQSGMAQEAPELALKHPRRGHQLTVVDGKIWVTGGKSYQNHFTGWGEDGKAMFSVYPNVEVIDPVAQTVTYTDIPGSKLTSESIAFKSSPESTTIYLAGVDVLHKIDTKTMKMTEIKDFGFQAGVDKNAPHQTGVLGETNKGYWGWLTIKGKPYTVLVASRQLLFFDASRERFVKIPGVDPSFPNQMSGGTVINNKFYLFGGHPDGTDEGTVWAWVFDPNAPTGKQLQRIADLPFNLSGPPRVENVRGKAYIIGGSYRGNCLNTILRYDPVSNSYTRKADLPAVILNHASCVLGEQILISYGYAWGTAAEGRQGDRMHPPTMLVYNPLADTTVGSLNIIPPQSGSGLTAVLKNRVYQIVTDQLRIIDFQVDDLLKELGGPTRKEVRIHLVGIEQNTKEQTKAAYFHEGGLIFRQIFTSEAPVELVTIYYHLPDRNNAFYVPGGRIVYKMAFTKQEAMLIDWSKPENADFDAKVSAAGI